MLDLYRDELKTINEKLLDSIQSRKEIVDKIHQFKLKNSLNAFDQKREIKLFKSLILKFETLTIEEIFSFSLIMENHANFQSPDYPKWSQQEHLVDKSDDFLDGTNPILLALFHKQRYDRLNIKPKYRVNI